MTCHRFQQQVPDWLSRRLSPEHSEEMATHEQECSRCRRTSRAEADLRQCFREAMPPPALPDLWPRLALRLETEEPKKTGTKTGKQTGRRQWFPLLPRQWAFAPAVVLVALAACWGHLPGEHTGVRSSSTTRPQDTHSVPTLTASSTESRPPKQTPTWSQIGSTAQDDPAVDDPVGPNVDTIWTCLNTASK